MHKQRNSFILGKQIREAEDVEVRSYGDCIGRCLQLRVIIDINNPLRKFVKLESPEEENQVIILLIRCEQLLISVTIVAKLGMFIECPEDKKIQQLKSPCRFRFKIPPWFKASNRVDIGRYAKSVDARVSCQNHEDKAERLQPQPFVQEKKMMQSMGMFEIMAFYPIMLAKGTTIWWLQVIIVVALQVEHLMNFDLLRNFEVQKN